MWTENIRPLSAAELKTLRGKWLQGATVLAWATRTTSGVGVRDVHGDVRAADVEAVAELALAGFWNWQGSVLYAHRFHPRVYRWAYTERTTHGKFLLFDGTGRSAVLAPSRVAAVVRDHASVREFARHGTRLATRHRS